MVLKGNKSDSHCLSPHWIHLENVMAKTTDRIIFLWRDSTPAFISSISSCSKTKKFQNVLEEGCLWVQFVSMCLFITSWERLLLFYPEELFSFSSCKYLPNNRFTVMLNKTKHQPVIFFLPILHPLPLLGRLSMRSAHQHLPSNGHVEKDLCYFPLSLFKHHKWHVWVDESWC